MAENEENATPAAQATEEGQTNEAQGDETASAPAAPQQAEADSQGDSGAQQSDSAQQGDDGQKGDDAQAPAAAPQAEVKPEEITYHAVEKDGQVTAIWEMQGNKHLRTIDPRSRQGQEILRLYTAEHPEEAQQQ